MTDEIKPTDPDDEWCNEAILEIFRLQVEHLELAREQLRRMPKAKPSR